MRYPQNLTSEIFVNLLVSWNGFIDLSIRPDLMVGTLSKKPPTQVLQLPLKILFLHSKANVHKYMDRVKPIMCIVRTHYPPVDRGQLSRRTSPEAGSGALGSQTTRNEFVQDARDQCLIRNTLLSSPSLQKLKIRT